MKLTLSWLEDHLDTTAKADEVAATLTRIGLEVEGVEDRGRALAAFVVGHVVEARQHPNADRLRLCRVDTGAETIQVVCGAPNARTGMKGVFAKPGTRIPGTGMVLQAGIIRGEASNGMLCSERELGLSDEHEGIIELAADAPIGAPFARLAGLDDPVIEVSITPNRSDCASVRGIARDLAAAGLGRLKPLDTTPVPGTFESPLRWRRDLPGNGDACPMVVGRSFRGLRNGPSPAWLQNRLRAVGLRPISALVDVTNYVTLDLGRPLHVFDAAKLVGQPTMRFARPGETIAALDGKTYTLDPAVLVIADDRGARSIAGVMGGESSKTEDATTSVFLEVALFDPICVAATGRKLGIVSDARYRFERGVDPTSAIWGAEVAARMILALCGGEASTLAATGVEPGWTRSQTLRLARIAGLGGIAVEAAEARRILDALGFETTGDAATITAHVPPWRPDIHGEADLVEEVLRIHGFDKIPVVPMHRETIVGKPALTPVQRRTALVRRALAGRGMVEAVTFSFLSARLAAPFGGTDPALRIANPISADLDTMRPSVLPNLVDAARRNAARGFADSALFEVGPQYANDTPEGQTTIAGGVRAGASGSRHWNAPPRPVDAFDAKADAIAALIALGVATDGLQTTTDAPAWYHPGRSGTLRQGPSALAWFGELHPAALAALDVAGPIAAFEVMVDAVPEPKARRGAARPLIRVSAFQPVVRDFAFLVDDAIGAGQIVRAAKGADRKLVADVAVFDIYAGKGVEAGKKSVAIAVTLQPSEATLTDAEIEAIGARIVAAITKATGGALRG
ncbi:MAG: phenylalanine--tRNA ligase subunit beta [Alphaproteobacteria bacterium]|nr:phenylalanine--tRNA ligase subunit beta [Alphaproteobacteria bacterium]